MPSYCINIETPHGRWARQVQTDDEPLRSAEAEDKLNRERSERDIVLMY